MGKTAVFGGTFNPFHIGHYEILSALCKSDMFSKVLVVPDKIPPHKEYSGMVSDKDRIEMCRIVCEDFEKATVSLVEFEREGKSYTIDTISALREFSPGDEFFVTCGGDMIKTLDTWCRFDELKRMVSFIAFGRGSDKRFYADVMRVRALGADITVFNNKITDVSSSKLREHMDKEFLPEKVWDYVNRRGIYKQ